jgi:putative spermidine/putrescine transport system permease protein
MSHPQSTAESQTSLTDTVREAVTARRLFTVYAVAITIYIYLPILSLIGFSFNQGGLTFPFVGFSLQWYAELLSNQGMLAAIRRSLQLAFVTMIVTTVLATAMALAYRREFLGKRLLLFLLILGIITPGITYGVGATLFLNEILGLPKNIWLALTVHVAWALPFSFIVLLAGFPPYLAQNERAARVMGADNVTVYREIIFPQIAPTVLGAAVFAFTLSYNEATRGLLIIGQRNTMPLEVFAIAASKRPTPELFALGSITTVVSTVLLVVAGLVVLRSSRASGEGDGS